MKKGTVVAGEKVDASHGNRPISRKNTETKRGWEHEAKSGPKG